MMETVQAKPSEKRQAADVLAEMFRKAAVALNEKYIQGTDDFVAKHHPGLRRKLKETEDGLNEVWLTVVAEKADVAAFRDVLKEWYELHIQAREIYQAAKK